MLLTPLTVALSASKPQHLRNALTSSATNEEWVLAEALRCNPDEVSDHACRADQALAAKGIDVPSAEQ